MSSYPLPRSRSGRKSVNYQDLRVVLGLCQDLRFLESAFYEGLRRFLFMHVLRFLEFWV